MAAIVIRANFLDKLAQVFSYIFVRRVFAKM